ncbi:Short-chain dehydrogenase/reductase SDR [Fusarium oxysporum f. sp. vasinfectum]|nr:Short-chain dehydrogenase/reductase SDR [Fusarium oxysporum f. sp. vasinfectum]
MSLEGKVVLITGGAKNLGAEIALSLASIGGNLALHYNSPSTKNNADVLAKTISQSFPKVKYEFYQGDLTTKAAVDNLFESVLKDFNKVDIVINTIGKVLKKSIAEISEAEYDSMFDVNSKSAFLILQAGAKHVEDGGKIITIVTALLACLHWHFTRGVAKELMGRRISVNAVAPGPMDTPFFYPQEADDAVAFHKSQALEGRLTNVKDIAPLVRFLVTEGGWITGQTIFANGGYTTR